MPKPLPDDQIDADRVYRFGDFDLYLRARRLTRLGRPVAIQLKPFELLVHLIEHRHRVVPRSELLARVWRGVHVDESTVRFALHSLRRAIGDDGNQQRVIRTMPGLGFQFVGPIEQLGTSGNAEPGAPDEANRDDPLGSLFLGRTHFLSVVQELLDNAARGEGRALLLSGEAGIGKTRALEQLVMRAETRGFRVLQGRCVESEGAPAFWPWIQMLRTAVGADPPHSLLRGLAETAPEVAWMVPELRPFVPDVPAMRSLDAQAARFLLFDGLTSFLSGLAVDRPCLLCIDDLHRADTASMALLLHIARELARTEPTHLALVGAYRDRELRAAPALADLMVSTSTLPEVRSETLRGLERADVSALVQKLSGRTPSPVVVAELHHKTGGNPFFVHQMLRVLESENRLGELESKRPLELGLPGHVQDAICRQFRLLEDRARELIEFACVIGREFAAADLEAAMQLSREELLERLGQAVDAGVVSEQGREYGRFWFVHVLVGDAIYARLPLELRASIHGRVARAIEARSGSQPNPESALLAHHYAHSSSAGDRERAIRAYEMAARWCSARGAFENAPEYLERALALLCESARPAEADRCRLLLQLGDALTNAGDRARARECLQTAAEIAQQHGFHEELAAAALHFAPEFLAIETGVYDPELVRLLEAAIASLGDAPTALRARLLARLAIALQWSPEDARSRAMCDEASAIAARIDDEETRQSVSIARSLIHFSLVEPERQLLHVPSGQAASASLDLLGRLLRITSLLLLGRVQEVDSEIALFAELAESSRHPQARWFVDLMRATRALMEGRYEEAADCTSRYLSLGLKIGDRNAPQSHAAQELMRAFDVGGLEIYASRVRSIVETYPRMTAWRAALALVLAELDQVEEARSELDRVFAANPLDSSRPNEWYGTATALALAAGAVGAREIGDALYGRILPQADQLIVFGYCSYCVGSTHRLLAALATAADRWDIASAHFEAALSRNAAVGAFACNARVHFEFARMWVRAGRSSDGILRAKRAEAVALQFGMGRLAARSRDLWR